MSETHKVGCTPSHRNLFEQYLLFLEQQDNREYAKRELLKAVVMLDVINDLDDTKLIMNAVSEWEERLQTEDLFTGDD